MVKFSQKITDNQTESMIYQPSYQKLIITLTIGVPLLLSTPALAQTKFELKKSIPKESTAKQPLFDLLNSDPPNLNPVNQMDNKWGSNPFFKQKKSIKIPEKKAPTEVPQSMDLYAYKITAIWKVNNQYKALLSGHIVQKGDQLNEVIIDKITEKDISVIRKGKKRSFRLGSTFYDFQI